MFALSLFFAGACCGYILTQITEELDDQSFHATPTGGFTNDDLVEHEQLSLQDVSLNRDECIAVISNSEEDEVQAQGNFSAESANANNSYAYLKDRIDLLPELLLNQQLEKYFDREYLDDVDDSRVFAKRLLDIALSDGDIRDFESIIEENVFIDIEFSLSPSSGLRHFSRLTEIDRFDRIFTHFVSSEDQPNLMVRWQHKETGEIFYFSPLKLTANQRIYISLSPQRGWQPGSYLISLYDLSNKQQLLTSSEYLIDSVLGGEESSPQVDQDVIEDLLSSGLAVPKTY